MSKRVFPALIAVSLVAACGGNPFQDDPGSDGGSPDTSVGSVYGDDLNNADLTMNSMVYDPDSNEIVVNNIPFDGATAANGQAVYAQVGTLPGGFGRYENTAGRLEYYAVFRRSASGAVEGGAFATNEYVRFGIGGAAAKRAAGAIALPSSGEFTFTGEYAAVRVFDSASGVGSPQYVTGTSTILVDFGDFDGVGAILGTVENRQVLDVNGAPIGAMDDYVSLALGDIDRATGTVDGGGATGRELVGGAVVSTGDWSAVFGGANANEIAGIVVLEGTVDDIGGTGGMRETGVIIALDPSRP
jgi:hypothetical protein